MPISPESSKDKKSLYVELARNDLEAAGDIGKATAVPDLSLEGDAMTFERA